MFRSLPAFRRPFAALCLLTPCVLTLCAESTSAIVSKIDLTPTDVASADPNRFTTFPTANPSLFLGRNYGILQRAVNFNTAPDGPLTEGGGVTNQYASVGVTMNDIRTSADIYGGNLYGAGYAAEDDTAQVYTFTTPVRAVGIVNTSPDKDRIRLYSGPNATGTLLLDFVDTDPLPINFNTDRFVGGTNTTAADTPIGSMVISNQGGNLEMDELVFARWAIPGDTNADGDVDFDDLLALAQNYGLTTGRLWETGDFHFDGATDFDDLLVLAQNYGHGVPGLESCIVNVTLTVTDTNAFSAPFQADWTRARALVPEPTLALAALAWCAIRPPRRSRQQDPIRR